MFDPYRKWLGLPEAQRPPTHYQLLGLAAGEADPEIIEEAAIRQTTHVRAYQIGPHAQECTRLLNEIAQARATLMDPAKRQKYDQTLAQKEKAVAARTAARPEPERPEPGPLAVEESPPPREAKTGKRPKRKSDSSRTGRAASPVWIYFAGGGGIVAVLAIVLVVFLSRPAPDVKQANNAGKDKTPPKKIVDTKIVDPKIDTKTDTKTADKADPVVKLPREKIDDDKKPVVPEVKPMPKPINPGPAGPSPLDRLDPEKIEAGDRVPTMPELVAVARGAKGELFGIGISPDSKWLGAVESGGQLTVWDVSGAEPGPAIALGPRGGQMSSVAFSPDSKQVASCDGAKVRIFDLSPPALKHEINLQAASYAGVAFSPDGKTLAVGDNRGVHLIDVATQVVTHVAGHKATVTAVSFSQDGSRMLTASNDGTLRVWNMKTNPPTQTHLCKGGSVMHGVISSDGKSAAAGERSGTVTVWDISGPTAEQRWSRRDHRQWANSVAFAPDDKTLISTEGGGSPQGPRYLNWHRADTGDLIKQIALPERSSQGVFAPGGQYVALTNHNRKAYIVRLVR